MAQPPTPAQKPQWQFWIDRGGTFTDIVAQRPDGSLVTHKLLSDNPHHYADAPLQGIRDLMGLGSHDPIPGEAIALIKMGTTVATNALLERRGDRTLLLITQGFADALRLGYQNRPDLFALQIQLPELIYERTIAVEERISAQGEIIQPLQGLENLRKQLKEAYADGIRGCAVVLIHSYRFPDHERRLADLARSLGFTQVSVSHQVSPLIKLVSRGETTVVDAYLSPVLRRYVDQIQQGLSPDSDSSDQRNHDLARKLLFMQSNGGLTAAQTFQGKDSLLSGPAGGLVGAVQVSVQAGFQRVITFDMGGTSTDVAHYGGDYERQWDTELAGVRLRAPMLAIHTVAAGGGSLLRIEGGRYQVGPASAGSNPGPACYGRGGPLTVTDANVQLGYLQPAFFPHLFGSDGQQPIDPVPVQQQFAALAATGDQAESRPEVLAAGFRTIAIENMANAIQKISVQRGYELSLYVLCCFGAAGGQHVCALAQRLGMTQILIHPLGGVLSAYGMGVADRRLLKEQSLELPLTLAQVPTIAHQLHTLASAGRSQLIAQGIPDVVTLEFDQRLYLRYGGSDSPLAVPWPENLGSDMEILHQLSQQFEQQHHQRYGFVLEDQPLVVALVAVEVVGRTGVGTVPPVLAAQQGDPPVAAIVACFYGDTWQDTPVYYRCDLGSGCIIPGPALILEPTGTNLIEPGWQATVTVQGNLLLNPTRQILSPPRVPGIGMENAGAEDPAHAPDPVLLEIFNNRLMAIAEQMGFTLQNTSQSVNIKERLDFSCALFDSAGQLVANAPHIPVHLGSMGEAVQALRAARGSTWRSGEVYVSNNPYDGGTHLPDITVITPIFLEESQNPDFYVASRGHHSDIGGISPGSMPAHSQCLEEEGVLLDNLPLVQGVQFQGETLLRHLTQGPYPARNPTQNLGDLQAQIAANEKGVQELKNLVRQYGRGTVRAYLHHVQANGAEAVRRVIDRLAQSLGSDPRPPFRVELDNGAQIQVAISFDPHQRTATLDFGGTSPQQPHNFNAPLAVCKAVVLYVFRTLVPEPIPLNAGCLEPLILRIPPGSLLHPHYPAAVVAGNVETSQAIADALYGALGILAASQGTMNNLTFGNGQYQYYETLCGGSGAGSGFAGTDGVQTHMTNSRLTDPEVLELRFPVRLLEFRIRPHSGGSGQYRGGHGVVRRLQFLEPMTVNLLSDRRRIAPFGLNGGLPGSMGHNSLERRDGSVLDLGGTATVAVAPGDVLTIATPGGGGFGSPDAGETIDIPKHSSIPLE
ncbi:hydantoinase B/oxoprolinase family protein [Prochlorothrix hollandica]|uniref:hydantoinase B/oxoprolinase family protein n=1 Tax=Prochlorothrix hollandica TaxID=1223 RepID=UPI00334102C5